MAEPIDIQINVTGADQAARGVDGVTRALEGEKQAAEDAGQATDQAGASFGDMTRGGLQLVQRVQGIAGAIQGLVGALGSHDRTAGLIASVAGTTAQFAAMGAMLGPGGVVLGGIVGLGTALYGLVNAHNDAATAADNQADSIDGVAASVVGLGEVMLEWRDVLGIENSVRSGDVGGLSSATLDAELREREARLLELRVSNAESGALVRSEEEIRLTREADALRAERDRRAAPDDPAGRGGGSSVTEYESENSQARGLGATDSLDADERAANADAIIAERDAAIEADQARIRSANERHEAEMALAEEKHQAMLDLAREGYEAQEEIEAEYLEHRREMADEERDNRKAEYEREHEEAISRQQELMGMGMQASKMLVNAIGDVISGAKSGEEAFLGLLKGFLEMISEYAILSATREFADAISSFASQNYAGGAQHLAAGIAFVGLAAATGIGAAAIQVPSGAQAPARPEPQKEAGGSGGTSYVINWNSPVVTAGTRSELGRELTGLISEAEAA